MDFQSQDIVTVKGFLLNKKQFTFYCPFCSIFHTHGLGAGPEISNSRKYGHRGAHCTENSPFNYNGYLLEEFNKGELKKNIELATDTLNKNV